MIRNYATFISSSNATNRYTGQRVSGFDSLELLASVCGASAAYLFLIISRLTKEENDLKLVKAKPERETENERVFESGKSSSYNGRCYKKVARLCGSPSARNVQWTPKSINKGESFFKSISEKLLLLESFGNNPEISHVPRITDEKSPQPGPQLSHFSYFSDLDAAHAFQVACFKSSQANAPWEEIRSLFEFSAHLGHSPLSSFNAALLWDPRSNLCDLPSDAHRAIVLYKQAGNEGHARSCFRLAMLYLEIVTEERQGPFSLAIEWLRKASVLGFLKANQVLAMIYSS
jgi:hypothetical protein